MRCFITNDITGVNAYWNWVAFIIVGEARQNFMFWRYLRAVSLPNFFGGCEGNRPRPTYGLGATIRATNYLRFSTEDNRESGRHFFLRPSKTMGIKAIQDFSYVTNSLDFTDQACNSDASIVRSNKSACLYMHILIVFYPESKLSRCGWGTEGWSNAPNDQRDFLYRLMKFNFAFFLSYEGSWRCYCINFESKVVSEKFCDILKDF